MKKQEYKMILSEVNKQMEKRVLSLIRNKNSHVQYLDDGKQIKVNIELGLSNKT